MADALSRLFNHESEFNEYHAHIAHQSEGCLNFPKSDKSLEAEINHLAVLEQTSRSLPVKINSHKSSKNWNSKKPNHKNFVNLVAEIPLAFDNLTTHQNNDVEFQQIIQKYS